MTLPRRSDRLSLDNQPFFFVSAEPRQDRPPRLTISCFPADTPARTQIDNDGHMQPVLAELNIRDIRTPFLMYLLTGEVLIVHVGSHRFLMGTVCRVLKAGFLAGCHTFGATAQTGCVCAPDYFCHLAGGDYRRTLFLL